jgi:hypothetical protein
VITAIVIWVIGLVTFVPAGTYHLFFHAERDQYALLITTILFWIFGYWSVVGPIIMVVRIRRLVRAIQIAKSPSEVATILTSDEARDTAIEYMASEARVPKFVARWFFHWILKRVLENIKAEKMKLAPITQTMNQRETQPQDPA